MTAKQAKPSLRRAALGLSLSALMLAGLAGCDRRTTTTTDGNRTTTTTTTTPAASAASR